MNSRNVSSPPMDGAPAAAALKDDAAPTAEVESPPGPEGHRAWRSLSWTALAVGLLAGIAVRLHTGSALWLDEAISVEISSLPLGRVDDALRLDGAPPVYAVLLWAWQRLFGDSPGAVRSLSALFGIAALPLMALAGRRVAGTGGGVAAGLLLASSPFAVYYSAEARMYSLVMLLVLCGFLALDRFLQVPSWPRGGAVSLITGLLALTHYWALFLLAAVSGLLLLRAWHCRSRVDARAVGWMALGGLLFLPWLPSFLFQLAHTGTPWGDPAGLSAGATTIRAWVGTPWSGGEPKLLALLLVLLALLGAGAGRIVGHQIVLDLRGRAPGRALAFVTGGTLLLGIVVGRLTGGTFAARYTSVMLPLFLLLVTVGLSRLPRRARAVALAVAVVLGFAGALPNLVRTDKTQAAEIASALRGEARPGDVVVYCPDQLGPAVSRLLPDDLQQQVYPTGQGPSRVDWVDYEERNQQADPTAYATALSRTAGNRAIWLVSNPEYRTYEGHCQGLARTLTELRGDPLCLVERDGFYYEHADLRGWPTKDRRDPGGAATSQMRALIGCPAADVPARTYGG